MVDGGVRNVLVSNEIVDRRKIERLAPSPAGPRSSCASTIRGTSTTSRRRRARPGCASASWSRSTSATPLRRRARRGRRRARPARRGPAESPLCRPPGHHGRAQHINQVEKRRAAIQTGIADVRNTVDLLKRQGLACELVSGAGTGSYRWEAASGVHNEVQAGSDCFMDVEYNLVEGLPCQFRQSLSSWPRRPAAPFPSARWSTPA